MHGGAIAPLMGLELDGSAHMHQISPARAWKLRLALDQMLQQGRTHTSSLECVLGHYTWLAMVCRPCLCIFNHTYVSVCGTESPGHFTFADLCGQSWLCRGV